MEEREYFVPLPEGAILRVKYYKDRSKILRFVVQLEAYLDDQWVSISRYDMAHGYVHRDDLKPDGSQLKSPPMFFVNNEDAMNYAIRDLRSNYPLYLERFLRWKR